MGLTNLSHNLVHKEYVEGSFCAISGFKFGSFRKDNEFSVGDSSRLIPPFVGNGMSMAIESADIAAEKLERYSRGKLKWDQAIDHAKKELNQIFSKRMLVASALHPLLMSKFGLTAIDWTSRMKLLPVSSLYKWTR